jgi:hypothetical protein
MSSELGQSMPVEEGGRARCPQPQAPKHMLAAESYPSRARRQELDLGAMAGTGVQQPS